MKIIKLIVLCFPIILFAHDGHRHFPVYQPGSDELYIPGYYFDLEDDSLNIRKIINPCNLTIQLVDFISSKTIYGVIRIWTNSGKRVILNDLLPRGKYISEKEFGLNAFKHINSWSVLPGKVTINVPREKILIEAFTGIQTELAWIELDLTNLQKADIKIPLKRIPFQDKRKWFKGNTHLHYKKVSSKEAELYTLQVPKSDNYDIVFFSYLERKGVDTSYVSNNFTRKDLDFFTKETGIIFGYGEEYRHNGRYNEGYGHAMFLDLKSLILPASFGYSIMRDPFDDGSIRDGIIKARQQGATILWCHNKRGNEDIPNWIEKLIDALIIFDQGNRGTYEDTFYRYYNIGLQVPFATGTDWFLRDMSGTFVLSPEPLTKEGWLESLQAGKSFVSNGPLLKLEVNDKDIGDKINLVSPQKVSISGMATGRRDFKRLELVQNGKVIHSVTSTNKGNYFNAELEIKHLVDKPCWIALRIPPFENEYNAKYDKTQTKPVGFNEFGKPLYAHTTPIYITIMDSSCFDIKTASSLINEMKESIKAINKYSNFSKLSQKEKTLSIYKHAINILQTKISEKNKKSN